jgi:hypothetical protein
MLCICHDDGMMASFQDTFCNTFKAMGPNLAFVIYLQFPPKLLPDSLVPTPIAKTIVCVPVLVVPSS